MKTNAWAIPDGYPQLFTSTVSLTHKPAYLKEATCTMDVYLTLYSNGNAFDKCQFNVESGNAIRKNCK